jgi:hypothetical protein
MNLYKISNSYQGLVYQLGEVDHISDEHLLAIDNVKEDLSNKSINVASFIKNMEIDLNGIELAMDEMKGRKIALESKINRMKEYLKYHLIQCDINEIKSPYFDIKLKTCPPSVNILDESQISDEYKVHKDIISIDKIKIKNDILQGVVIDGAELKNNITLQIK